MMIKTRSFFNGKLSLSRGIILYGLAAMAVMLSATKPAMGLLAEPDIKVMHWTVDGVVRDAMVYVPAAAKSKATPVVFMFHGHGGTMINMFKTRGFDKLWPEAIIVCPQGLNTPGQLTDPDGRLPGWQKAPGDMSDRDLHFFDAMLQTFKQDYQVDEKRIYATGHSNGGGFTYVLWAARGEIFAAVAPSGAAALRFANQLQPKPAMHIMGENDPLVKPEWQKMMCNQLLKINHCTTAGEKYDTYATLYASTTNNPVLLYVYPGGHVYPEEANAVVIRFFKSMVKP